MIHPKIINPVHIEIETIRLNVICLVGVNKLGINPKILHKKKNINNELKNLFLPSLFFFKAIEN